MQLLYSPDGDFAQDGQQVPLALGELLPGGRGSPPGGGDAVLHYQGINELQLFPASPLVAGYYEVVLAGQSVAGSVVLADPDGNDLDADAANPQGQDVTIPFQVDGIEGRTGADATEDDTPATAQDLGDITSAGIVQVAGVIGDDPIRLCPEPGGHVSLHRQRDGERFARGRGLRRPHRLAARPPASASSGSTPTMAASSSSRATSIATIPR